MTEDEFVEAMARGIARQRFVGKLSEFDAHWQRSVMSYRKLCAEWAGWANASGFPNSAFSDARAALSALREAGIRLSAESEIVALSDAAWQVLDDMGADGQSCCLAAKAQLRHAYEPFRGEDPCDYQMADAKAVLVEVGAISADSTT